MAAVKLSAANIERIKSLKEKHKSRSLRKKDWDFMLNVVIEGISDAQWEKMIDQHIPDEVVIRQALSNPEAKKAIADYIRKNAKKSPKAEKVLSPSEVQEDPALKAS